MPNWCSNHITVRGTDPVAIKRLATAFDNGEFCNTVVPCPEDLQITSGFLGDPVEQAELERKTKANVEKYGYGNWYDFQTANWGTKWEISGDGNTAEIEDDGLSFSAPFESAWSPPIGVCEALVEQGFEVGAFFICAVDGASQGHWVPHVQVVPSDVVVAHQHQLVVAGQFILDECLQSMKPVHFVNKLVAVGRLSIGEIRAHHPHTVDGGGDHTRHFVGKAWDVVHHLGDGMLGNQRHTVVGFLAEESHLVASRFNLGFGKFVVGGFGFLQSQHIHTAMLGLC